MPNRVQMSRKAGWRKPENTFYVGRPGRFGNPFKHADSAYAVKAFRALIEELDFGWYAASRKVVKEKDLPCEIIIGDLRGTPENPIYSWHPDFPEPLMLVRMPNIIRLRQDLKSLRGKNLACWCSLDKACHADVLLELANA